MGAIPLSIERMELVLNDGAKMVRGIAVDRVDTIADQSSHDVVAAVGNASALDVEASGMRLRDRFR